MVNSVNKKLRILRVISSVNPLGGGPIEGIKQLYLVMKELGVELEVACCDEPNSPWLPNCGLPIVHALGPAYLSYQYSPRLIPWIRENASRFDVVIIHGIWQHHSYAVRKALKGTKIPYFILTHGMLDPWFREAYPLKHLKKYLYWCCSEYRVLRDAKSVIFTSETEQLLAGKSFQPYKIHGVVTNYGTGDVPDDRVRLTEKFYQSHPALLNKRIILYLGRIHPKKGCDILIEAFAKIAEQDNRLHLVIAGPDQTGLTNSLQDRATKIGIKDRISWLGMLQGDEKWATYFASEVFCLPSHQENFGIVVAEAMACGIPVLISNKVNIWREIEKSGGGYVDQDTVAGTFNNLCRWLALDLDGYTKMAADAKLCFSEKFHIEKAGKRLLEIINPKDLTNES